MAAAWPKKILGPTGSVMGESLFLSQFTAMLPLQLGLLSNFLKNWPCFYPFHHYHLVLSHHSLPLVSVFTSPFSLQKPEGDFQLSSQITTPLFQILQWLFISFRIKVKGLVMAYTSLPDLSPLHLHSIRFHYSASQSLCSSHTCFLAGPWT